MDAMAWIKNPHCFRGDVRKCNLFHLFLAVGPGRGMITKERTTHEQKHDKSPAHSQKHSVVAVPPCRWLSTCPALLCRMHCNRLVSEVGREQSYT